MRAIVSRDVFIAALTRAASVADAKSPMPVLGCVLISVTDALVELLACDLKMSVRSTLAAQKPEPGQICVPAADLLARVKTFPPGDVTLTVKDGDDEPLTVTSGTRKHVLHAPADVGAFPKVKLAPKAQASMPASVLIDALKRTLPAANRDASRSDAAVCLEVGGGFLRTRATDGHRMHAVDVKVEGVTIEKCMLHASSVKELLGLPSASNVAISVEGEELFFASGPTTLSTKAMPTPHQPYDNVLSLPTDVSFDVDRDALVDSIRSVSLATGKEVTTGLLKFALSPGSLEVSGKSPDGKGSGEDVIDADYQGHASFHTYAAQLIDALNVCEGERVRLRFEQGNPGTPTFVSGVDNPDIFRALVMQAIPPVPAPKGAPK